MARARTIKGEAFRHEGLGELSPLHRWLFAGLWTIADREGRLEDRPKRIKIEVLPWDDCDCDRLLSDLEAAGFIIRYEVDGRRAIAIPSWGEHQHPHPKEQPSTITPPCESKKPRQIRASDGQCRNEDTPSREKIVSCRAGSSGSFVPSESQSPPLPPASGGSTVPVSDLLADQARQVAAVAAATPEPDPIEAAFVLWNLRAHRDFPRAVKLTTEPRGGRRKKLKAALDLVPLADWPRAIDAVNAWPWAHGEGQSAPATWRATLDWLCACDGTGTPNILRAAEGQLTAGRTQPPENRRPSPVVSAEELAEIQREAAEKRRRAEEDRRP